MNLPERKENEARRLIEALPAPPVPAGLYEAALRRGRRLRRARRRLRRAGWLLLCLGALAFAVWALRERPWVEPPTLTTPPLQRW